MYFILFTRIYYVSTICSKELFYYYKPSILQCNGKCECGVFIPNKKDGTPIASTNAKIYKGSSSPNNERYPWYVHVLECGANEAIDHCFNSGGTLISKKHILTCAHCIKHVLQQK